MYSGPEWSLLQLCCSKATYCNEEVLGNPSQQLSVFVLQAPNQLKLTHLNNTADPICAITAHQHLLLVARSSGVVHAFSLPTLSLEGQCVLRSRPQRLLLNCDCSKVAVVDFAGVLSLLMLTQGGPGKLQGEQLSLERKVGPASAFIQQIYAVSCGLGVCVHAHACRRVRLNLHAVCSTGCVVVTASA
jgi:hypothetical protein